MEAVMFFVCGAICLIGAIGVVVARNPVHSALMLVLTLFGVAVLFIVQEAYFLAAVQVIVYAGAIVVLFLFVIMLVGVDKAEDIRTEPIVGQRAMAALVGAATVALAVIVGLVVSGDVTGQPGLRPMTEGEDNIRELGRLLFTDAILAVEITAILLTIAVVAAVLLAKRPPGELQPIPDVEPPWPIRRPAPPPEPVAATEADDPAPDPEPDA